MTLRTLPLFTLFAFLSCTANAAPVVVEMFTSKYCPSCPAAEKYLAKEAAATPNLLVVLENVDYWNRPGQIDPHSNPDFTQRQYDYSNQLADRPGKVFTPQPIINGSHVAEPPLWMNWSGAMAQATSAPSPLQASATAKGGLVVSLPAGTRNTELTVIGLEKIDAGPLWRAKGVKQFAATGDTASLASTALPAGSHVLVLLQEVGPGRILAAAHLSRTP